LKDRFDALNGKIAIESPSEHGTVIDVEIPVQP
jgi:signal transduction histidine kinase